MSDGATDKNVGTTPARRRQKVILLAIIAVAAIVLATPPLMRLWMERDLCPSEVTKHGFSPKARWEISRADCGGGRIVHQLRIVPPKGYSVLVYESERGPLPLSWDQSGFVGRLELDRPLEGESGTVIEVALDPKGRPKAPVLVRDGRRVPMP